MSRQTSVSFTPNAAIPGDVHGDIGASLTRAASVVMQGGLLVVTTSNDDDCKLPTTGNDITSVLKPLGITRSNVARDPNFPSGGTAGFTYQIGDSVEIVSRGRVWVTVEEAVSPSDDVYVRHTANGDNTQRGAFRTSSDSSNAALLAGARYLTTASANGVALVDLNLPQ